MFTENTKKKKDIKYLCEVKRLKKIIIRGGKALTRTIIAQGSKNAALPIIAAGVLLKKRVELYNIPDISDIQSFIEIINFLGCKTKYKKHTLTIENEDIKNKNIPKRLTKRTRASFLFYGALLARFNKAKVSNGGGCKIGKRPLDIHKKAFEDIKIGKREILLPFPSVGATENLLIYMAGRKEKFIIKNASVEPEVQDLINFLKKAGAKITRKGRSFFIQGGELKESLKYEIMPDRIVALTYIMAGKITGGKVVVPNINYKKFIMPILKEKNTKKITTGVHPKFPTDAGAIVLPYLSLQEGNKIRYKETIFEKRMGILEELYKAGAEIEINKNEATITGVKKLTPRKYKGKDLRMTAGLVLAGLATEGESEITGIEYLERGYESFVENLKELGADIEIIEN